jgi:hypothetical protein
VYINLEPTTGWWCCQGFPWDLLDLQRYGCGIGIVGGRIGGMGIEGITDRVVRNGIR